jgi:hypothetical protein
MRNARVMYAGLWSLIFGLFILLGVGLLYVWETRSKMWFDTGPFVLPAIIGAILFIIGLLVYLFVGE